VRLEFVARFARLPTIEVETIVAPMVKPGRLLCSTASLDRSMFPRPRFRRVETVGLVAKCRLNGTN